MISQRATVEPQYENTPLAGMYGPSQPTCMSALVMLNPNGHTPS